MDLYLCVYSNRSSQRIADKEAAIYKSVGSQEGGVRMVVPTIYLVAAAFFVILTFSVIKSSIRPANFPPGELQTIIIQLRVISNGVDAP